MELSNTVKLILKFIARFFYEKDKVTILLNLKLKKLKEDYYSKDKNSNSKYIGK